MHALLLAAALASAPVAPEADAAQTLSPARLPALSRDDAAAPPARARALAPSTPSAAAVAPSSSSVVLPGLALLALAAIALYVSRRQRPAPQRRLLEVVETANLGPRRSLVVARVGGEALVLGVSEAGIALLATRPASELAPQIAATGAAAAARPFEEALRSAQSGDLRWENPEVAELRRKLQAASAQGAQRAPAMGAGGPR